MTSRAVIVVNQLGLHARAAAKLVQTASAYSSDISVLYNSKKVSAKSIMGIMMLAASRGTTIEIVASGKDEQEALYALESLIVDRFGEPE